MKNGPTIPDSHSHGGDREGMEGTTRVGKSFCHDQTELFDAPTVNPESGGSHHRHSSDEEVNAELRTINNGGPSSISPRAGCGSSVGSGSGGGRAPAPPSRQGSELSSLSDGDATEGLCVALVDSQTSPYDRHALRYKKGDVIQIISKKPSGSWTGRVNNQVGHFKFINVQLLPDPQIEEDDDGGEDEVPSKSRDFDGASEGDYSRDEDYYYNSCTARGGDEFPGPGHSPSSGKSSKKSLASMTPWELEQRQTVASVINGIRKENAALRERNEKSVGGDSVFDDEEEDGSNNLGKEWRTRLSDQQDLENGEERDRDCSLLLTTATGMIPAVKSRSSSSKSALATVDRRRQGKDPRPKSVGDLLRQINLEEHISVFILHGFESLNLFKELEEEDLDRLAILNEQDRIKILTAAELLREYDEEIPIPPLPPSSSSSKAFQRSFATRDSGIFVKCDEEDKEMSNEDRHSGLGCDRRSRSLSFEADEASIGSSSSTSTSNLMKPQDVRHYSGNTELLHNNPYNYQNPKDMIFAPALPGNPHSNNPNPLDSLSSGGGSGRDEELILSPLNLQKKMQEVNRRSYESPSSSSSSSINPGFSINNYNNGGPGIEQGRVKQFTEAFNAKSEMMTNNGGDPYVEVKQRFQSARSMFEAKSKQQEQTQTSTMRDGYNNGAGKNRFLYYEKSSDSGISCSNNNSPPLVRSE